MDGVDSMKVEASEPSVFEQCAQARGEECSNLVLVTKPVSRPPFHVLSLVLELGPGLRIEWHGLD